MGRKAKEEAQQKIGNWTKSRRNLSKTTTKENTNASNNIENRAPLQTKSQDAINSMKNLSVCLDQINLETVSTTPTKPNKKTTGKRNNILLECQSQSEKIPLKKLSIRLECLDSKTIEELVSSSPKPFAAVEKIFKKDKKTDIENVYDYTFDNDAIPLETEDAMKDVYEKLAKENKIEVKKYRAKNVKKQPEKKVAAKKEKTQKRHRDKQPAEIEPPQKKPNLQNKKVNNLNIAPSATKMKTRANIESIEKNNNMKIASNAEKRVIEKSKTNEEESKNVSLNEKAGDTFARLRLRNRIQPNLQSTPKTSTPLNIKTVHFSNFNDESPVLISETREKARELTKQRLQLSTAEESNETNRASPVQENDSVQFFDDDDFPMPSVGLSQDKENALTVLGGIGAAPISSNKPKDANFDDNSRIFSPTVRRVYGRSPLKNITSEVNNIGASFDSVQPNQQNRDSFGLLVESHSTQSSLNSKNSSEISSKGNPATFNKNRSDENEPQPSTSKNFNETLSYQSSLASSTSTNLTGLQASRNNKNRSIENEPQPSTSKGITKSANSIFSPTKRKVYGRSPLKNITSDENSSHLTMLSNKSNSSKINDIGSMSTLNSIHNSRSINVSSDPKNTLQLTLPGETFSSGRRQSPIEIYFESSQANNIDDCFGFDDDDDHLDEECAIENVSEKLKVTEKQVAPAIELKNIREKLKRFLHSNESEATATKQSKSSNNTAPRIANKQKKLKTPVKQNTQTIFADPSAKKQKDIRSALTAQVSEKEKSNKSSEHISAAPLFEEVEMVKPQQIPRKSYCGPVKQYRKRHVSIDSEPEEISDDDDENDENFEGKSKKPKAKRRKKLMDSDPKENVELEEFAKKMNDEFAEIAEFPLLVENN